MSADNWAQNQVVDSNWQQRYGFTTDALSTQAISPLRNRGGEWEDMVSAFMSDEALRDTVVCPEDLTVVTYHNRSESVLEHCLSHIGVPVQVLKVDAPWQHEYKFHLLSDWLPDCKTRYLLALDADDVLWFGDMQEALARFLDSSCRVLFGSDSGPGWSKPWIGWVNPFLDSFEEQRYSNAKYQHLNSGGFIGETAYIAECVSAIMDGVRNKIPALYLEGQIDDQIAWRRLHAARYPDIKIDSTPLIFSRLDTR